VRLRRVREILKGPCEFRPIINIHERLSQGREIHNASWEVRCIITFKLSQIDITCRLSRINKRAEEHVQQSARCQFQKKQKKDMMSAVIVYQKAEDYMLKYGLFGSGFLQVDLRED
jgi:hypothetical protein